MSRRGSRLGLAVAAVLLALVLASPAAAKFRMTLTLSDATPRVRQPVTATIRIPPQFADDQDLVMRLVLVPPGMDVYDAIRSETRYGISLARNGRAWRGTVRFTRPGKWRLVVPNWGAPGYALPPPIVRVVEVRR